IAIDLDLGTRPLAEEHAVAWLQIDRDELAGLVAAAGADGDDLALLRLLLGGIRNDDAALGLLLGVNTLYDHAVMQGTKLGLCHFFPRTWSSAKALKIKDSQDAVSTLIWRVPTAAPDIGPAVL